MNGLGLAATGGAVWGADAPGERALPAAVAKLPSMRALGRPISLKERRARLEKARELMDHNGIEAVLLARGTSLAYFTGVRWGNSERLFAAVLPVRGRAFCVCPAFEEDRAREQLNRGPLEDSEVLTWQEDESPYKLVSSGLRAAGKATGVLGVEERTPWCQRRHRQGSARIAPREPYLAHGLYIRMVGRLARSYTRCTTRIPPTRSGHVQSGEHQ